MAILLLVGSLAGLAYASPPDPSWVPGVYDDADFDDVVGLVELGAGLVVSTDLTDRLRLPLPTVVAALPPEQAPASPSADALQARPPPAS
ncbi:MAG TPA: hypothetical protein VMI34_13260 [Candidatus Bathyarchaeia archaeon]|nr:hypothetical protein [Candidatus Bathyarchaeia archaeon]